jgi:predicted ATP-grasp superfamily ATP-dependent carboligase
MPSRSHAKLPEAGAAILIAAPSGRALAAAARRAGYRPLAADFFDDADTRELCAANALVEGSLEPGFREESLLPALEALARLEAPCGLVYGAGFEDRPGLLEVLAQRWTLFGNLPEVVRQVKDPFQLASLCASLRIPHPEIRAHAPKDRQGWLVKSAGAGGGRHVAPAAAADAREREGNVYFQRAAPGDPVSVLFLADGANAQTVGLSRQWAAPAPGEPFRFGGSLRPAGLSLSTENKLRQAAEAVAAACRLRGLNSIDFLVDGSGFTLIEINPRPGATLDIFEDASGALFQAHVSSCLGRLPGRPLEFAGAAAAAIAYVRHEVPSMPALDWPCWTSDRQKPQTALRPHDPLCTVKARAINPARARMLVDVRTKIILGRLEQEKPRFCEVRFRHSSARADSQAAASGSAD